MEETVTIKRETYDAFIAFEKNVYNDCSTENMAKLEREIIDLDARLLHEKTYNDNKVKSIIDKNTWLLGRSLWQRIINKQNK
jgi:hypothetical protein